MCAYVCIYVYVYAYEYICVFLCVYMYAYVSVCICMCMCDENGLMNFIVGLDYKGSEKSFEGGVRIDVGSGK